MSSSSVAAVERARRVGWIGLGAMGAPMAQRLLAHGHALAVWARRPEAAGALLAAGAEWSASPAALAARCEVVFTMLTGPDDVVALHEAMLPAAQPATVFVDVTTASPAICGRIQALAATYRVEAFDAPVTGGVAGARDGALTCYAGASDAALAACRPLLDVIARSVVHCGAPGAGYRMKLVNQTMMAGVLLGLAHGIAQLRAGTGGAPPPIEALGAGSAGSHMFDAYARRMLLQTGPETFSLGLLRKDLSLARDEARRSGVATGFLDYALREVGAACERFGAQRGVQVLAA